jgi:hypothetical protein
MTTRVTRALAWGFCILAGAVFVVRGPVRAVKGGDDFAPPYAATRAFLMGEDPYDNARLASILLDAKRESDADGQPRGFNPALYPPSTFVILSPVALLDWPVARISFLLLSLIAVGVHLAALLRLTGLRFGETSGLILGGLVLALAPYHTGIALGQLAVPCVALIVIAIDRIERHSHAAGGTMMGVAALLKPQLAGPFILYLLWRHQRRAAVIAIGVGAAASLLALAWLWRNDIAWFASWRATTATTRIVGGPLDPAGPLSAQLIDLQPLLAQFSVPFPSVIALVIGAVLFVVILRFGTAVGAEHRLLVLSAVGTFSLLPLYHRFYDAALLCLPLAWAVTEWGNPQLRRASLGVGLCCAVFFVPGAWMLQVFTDRGVLPLPLTQGFVWNAVALRHQNWSLVLLMALLLYALNRLRRPAAGAS